MSAAQAASLQGQIDAILAAMPQASTAAPKGVADTSNVGTDPTKFSIEGHVHASKARKTRVTGVNTATYTWVYPTAFTAGVIPVCNGIAEDPAASAVDSYNVQVSGVPTNTQCVFTIKRTTVALGILGLNSTPGTINLHLSAFEP